MMDLCKAFYLISKGWWKFDSREEEMNPQINTGAYKFRQFLVIDETEEYQTPNPFSQDPHHYCPEKQYD